MAPRWNEKMVVGVERDNSVSLSPPLLLFPRGAKIPSQDGPRRKGEENGKREERRGRGEGP